MMKGTQKKENKGRRTRGSNRIKSSAEKLGLGCSQCAFVTLSAKELMGHIVKEHCQIPESTGTPACESSPSQNLKCPFCGITKETRKKLHGHVLRHTILDTFKCSHCNYWSSSSQTVTQHEKKCHEEPTEEESSDPNLTIDGFEITSFEELPCGAPSSKPLMIDDEDALPLLEPVPATPLRTDELFESPPTLQMEVSPTPSSSYTGSKPENTHSGRRLGRPRGSAVRKSILKKREHVENLNRPHKCKLCLFSGKTEDGLARHMTVHKKGRAAPTPSFWKYGNRESLPRGTVLRSPPATVKELNPSLKEDNLYHCSYCEFTQSSYPNFNYHQRQHKLRQPFKCSICPYWSKYPKVIARHEELWHKKSKGVRNNRDGSSTPAAGAWSVVKDGGSRAKPGISLRRNNRNKRSSPSIQKSPPVKRRNNLVKSGIVSVKSRYPVIKGILIKPPSPRQSETPATVTERTLLHPSRRTASRSLSCEYECSLCQFKTSDAELKSLHANGHIEIKAYKCCHCDWYTDSKDCLALHETVDHCTTYKSKGSEAGSDLSSKTAGVPGRSVTPEMQNTTEGSRSRSSRSPPAKHKCSRCSFQHQRLSLVFHHEMNCTAGIDPLPPPQNSRSIRIVVRAEKDIPQGKDSPLKSGANGLESESRQQQVKVECRRKVVNRRRADNGVRSIFSSRDGLSLAQQQRIFRRAAMMRYEPLSSGSGFFTAGRGHRVCPLCNVKFVNGYFLSAHRRSHGLDNKFNCNLCKVGFGKFSHLEWHLKTALHKQQRIKQVTVVESQGSDQEDQERNSSEETTTREDHSSEEHRATNPEHAKDPLPHYMNTLDILCSTIVGGNQIGETHIYSEDYYTDSLSAEQRNIVSAQDVRLLSENEELRQNKTAAAAVVGELLHCNLCQDVMIDKSELTNHLLGHVKAEKFKCSHCNWSSSLRSCVTRHEERAHTMDCANLKDLQSMLSKLASEFISQPRTKSRWDPKVTHSASKGLVFKTEVLPATDMDNVFGLDGSSLSSNVNVLVGVSNPAIQIQAGRRDSAGSPATNFPSGQALKEKGYITYAPVTGIEDQNQSTGVEDSSSCSQLDLNKIEKFKQSGLYRCNICNFLDTDPAEFMDHRKGHVNPRHFSCSLCPWFSDDKTMIVMHENTCHNYDDKEERQRLVALKYMNSQNLTQRKPNRTFKTSTQGHGRDRRGDLGSMWMNTLTKTALVSRAFFSDLLDKSRDQESMGANEAYSNSDPSVAPLTKSLTSVTPSRTVEGITESGQEGQESGMEQEEFTLTDKQIHYSVNAISTRASTLGCDICPFNTTDTRRHKSHMYGHQTVQQFKCSYCTWWSNLRSCIVRHENKWHNAGHTPAPPVKRLKAGPEPPASAPDQVTLMGRSEHVPNTGASPDPGMKSRLPCAHCNFTAGNIETLLHHMRDHAQEEGQGVMGDRKRKRAHWEEHFHIGYENDGDPLAVAPEDHPGSFTNKDELPIAENEDAESGWKIVSVSSLAALTTTGETSKVGVSRSECPGPSARDPPSSAVHSSYNNYSIPGPSTSSSISSFSVPGSSGAVRSSSPTPGPSKSFYMKVVAGSMDPIKLSEITTGVDQKHCPICKFVGSSPGGLSRHLRGHTQKNSFKCSFCPYWGSSKYWIRKHESDFHDAKPLRQYQRFRESNMSASGSQTGGFEDGSEAVLLPAGTSLPSQTEEDDLQSSSYDTDFDDFDDEEVLSPSEIIPMDDMDYDPREVADTDIGQPQYTNCEDTTTLKGNAEKQTAGVASHHEMNPNPRPRIPISPIPAKGQQVGAQGTTQGKDALTLLNNPLPVALLAPQQQQPPVYQTVSSTNTGSGEQALQDGTFTIPTLINFPGMMNVFFITSPNFTL